MITATKVISTEKRAHCFFFETRTISLCVDSFKDGICKVTGLAGTSAKDVIWAACGCFSKNSNFEKKLQKAFNTTTPLQVIDMDLNGIIASASLENHDPLPIFQTWKNKLILKQY